MDKYLTKKYLIDNLKNFKDAILDDDYISSSDIANDLTTNNSNKVLSASQGKILKDTIDGAIFTGSSESESIDDDPVLTEGDVVDNLTSTSTNRPLSAKQGKVLNERMENAISSVSTDTELTDIRVGANGTTYSSAGTAVRTQIATLSTDLADLFVTEELQYTDSSAQQNMLALTVSSIKKGTIVKVNGFNDLVFSVRKNDGGDVLKPISSNSFYPIADYESVYMVVRKSDSSNLTNAEKSAVKVTSNERYFEEDVKALKSDVSAIDSVIYEQNESTLNPSFVDGIALAYSSTQTTMATSGVACYCEAIDISAYKNGKLTYTALDYKKGDGTQGVWASHAFYKNSNIFTQEAFISARRTELPSANPSYQTITVDIPQDAKYVAFTFLTSIKSSFSAKITYSTSIKDDVEVLTDKVDVIENSIAKRFDSYIGNPQKYVSGAESGSTSLNLSQLYALWDVLVTTYPDLIRKNTDIGTSQINSLKIRHYTVGLSKYMCSNDSSRDIKGTNKWKADYDMPRFVLTSGVHGDEKGSVYGLYLFIKEMLEKFGTDDWADFIMCNSILEIVPCLNPNGYNTSAHGNGVIDNLNRDYYSASPQSETSAMKTFLASANFSGLIDLHNDGLTYDYLVSKSTYPDWNFFTQMSAKYSTMFFKAHKDSIDSQYFPYYEIWDAITAQGQIHDYATNVLNIPSISVECRGTTECVPTKNQLGNYLQMFIQRYS